MTVIGVNQVPPNDIESELGVLGSILLKPDCIGDLEGLKAVDFYADAHRRIFAHLRRMADAGKAIDIALLTCDLRDSGELDAIGGPEKLAEVSQSVPVPHHAAYYAARVRRAAKHRALIAVAQNTLRDAYIGCEDPDTILDRAEHGLSAIETGEYQGNPVPMADAVAEAMRRIEEIAKRREGAGVFTGILPFDQDFGGLFPGELVILGARPRVGKTSLASQIALHSGLNGRPVYFASLEMSGAEVATRVLCGEASVSNQQIRTGSIGEKEVQRCRDTAGRVAAAHVAIHDRAGMSVADITRAARRMAGHGLRLIVVDYLQRITPPDSRVQRYEQVGAMVRGMKSLARELSVPVLCLAQLGRAAETADRPNLAMLREAGDIEQEADQVLFLHRTGEETQDGIPVALIVEKNRNGATGDINLLFQPAGTRFVPVSAKEWDPNGGFR